MSSNSNGGSDADSGPGSREVAQRLFAAEFDDATFSYSESDEERAPNYVVSPTGARINRMFAVGVLTEVESVNEDIVRGRVVDATGPFVTYAGQYQPDEQAFLERTDPPAFVALTGKARTFEPEDGDRIYSSVRPENVNSVDADTRDRWLVTTAEATLYRIAVMRDAVASDLRGDDLRRALDAAGVPTTLATGIPYAIDHYGTTTAYLEAVRRLAVDALEVVAGDRDEVRGLDLAPDEGGSADLGALPDGVDLDAAAVGTDEGEEPDESDEGGAGAAGTEDADTGAAEAAEADSEVDVESESGAEPEPDVESEPGAEPATAESTSAASTGSTADSGDGAAEPAEAAAPDESPPTETAADEPAADESAEASATADAASTGSTVDAESDAAEPAEATDPGDADDLGDFDGDASGNDTADAADGADADEGMYELDEDERQEVEEEYGTEFSTGNEVDDAGEADIDVPDADDVEELAADADGADGAGETTDAATAESTSAASTGSTVDAGEGAAEPAEAADPADADDLGDFDAGADDTAESGTGETDAPDADEAESDDSDADDGGDEDAADVDLESAAVEVMEELDDGDGADREAVLAALVDRHGADPGDAEDAIQDALMSGQCYEPGEDTLKAI